jgi:hypothetical protein
MNRSRIRVYTLDICFLNSLRKWYQPTIWFPLSRILSPNRWVTVQVGDMKEYIGFLGNEDLVGQFPIDTLDGGRKGQNNIASCTALLVSTLVTTRSFTFTYVLHTPGTGG